ncbi:RND transporter [Asanoa ishikariensis]|uniref:HlyD family secretion protein n=1 Tax=Asanoa ishikariensis TaxID=137265 RepID=A0A1H3UKD4_9ACTN|nr:efflux RND transporter periplasmic adaptor subunit [Asanoa ishikariensis]GIF63358.1 RND transporter [Asanoa ishikariensis]SDZ62501.1 HlyD family secretion protein [Asanoa ishikariensis]
MGVRRKTWAVCGLVVLVVGSASAGAYALTRADPAPSTAKGTARVDRGDVVSAVATTGSLEPAQTRTLGFATAGTVTVVKVRPGDQVKAGQVLAEIDATGARERVDDARAKLDDARDALDKADDAGTTTCTVAFRTSPSPSPSATPTPTGRPTTSPSPTHRPTAPPSSQPTHATRDGGCTNQRGGDPLLSAQQRVNSADLALAEAQDQLAGTRIKAPIAGKVLTVAGVVGTDVGAGSTFVSVADVAGMQVAADFPEADANRLKVGQVATVTLANRPGDDLTARVVQVSPVGTADGDLVRYGVVLAFDENPADLLVGQSANVRVTTGEATGVLRVPSSAVHGDGSAVVRTAAGDQTRSVEVGLRGDQYTEIKTGLVEGDEVVTP